MSIPKTIDGQTKEVVLRYYKKNKMLSSSKIAELILKNEKIAKRNTLKSLSPIVSAVIKEQSAGSTDDFTLENKVDFDIPESLYEDYIPYQVPSNNKNILVLCDIHLPYHHKNALKVAIEDGVRRGVDTVILNGDTIDFYSISRFIKDPKFRDLTKELQVARQFLKYLRATFPDALIIFKTGNHEDRWKHHIWNHAADFANLLNLDDVLHLNDFGIHFVDDKQLIKAGKLYIAHGHEIFSASGAINVARNFRLKANDNVLFGHFHRTQDDYARDLGNSFKGAWAVGSLCGLSPLYMPINQWNNGFAVVEVEDSGMFEIHNKKVLNGVIK